MVCLWAPVPASRCMARGPTSRRMRRAASPRPRARAPRPPPRAQRRPTRPSARPGTAARRRAQRRRPRRPRRGRAERAAPGPGRSPRRPPSLRPRARCSSLRTCRSSRRAARAPARAPALPAGGAAWPCAGARPPRECGRGPHSDERGAGQRGVRCQARKEAVCLCADAHLCPAGALERPAAAGATAGQLTAACRLHGGPQCVSCAAAERRGDSAHPPSSAPLTRARRAPGGAGPERARRQRGGRPGAPGGAAPGPALRGRLRARRQRALRGAAGHAAPGHPGAPLAARGRACLAAPAARPPGGALPAVCRGACGV